MNWVSPVVGDEEGHHTAIKWTAHVSLCSWFVFSCPPISVSLCKYSYLCKTHVSRLLRTVTLQTCKWRKMKRWKTFRQLSFSAIILPYKINFGSPATITKSLGKCGFHVFCTVSSNIHVMCLYVLNNNLYKSKGLDFKLPYISDVCYWDKLAVKTMSLSECIIPKHAAGCPQAGWINLHLRAI